MHREGRFRVWRPKPKCECGHHKDCHNVGVWAGCQLCICQKFKLKQWARKEFARGQSAGGLKYDSGLEARVAADLNRQLACGEISDINSHYPIDIYIKGIKICRYYVDFRVVHNDETVEYIEVKGLWTDIARIKARLMETVFVPENPGSRYKVLR